MLHVVVLTREIPNDQGQKWIDEDPGTTAFGFYPVRDLLARHDLDFSGELLLVDDDGNVKFHKCINQEGTVFNGINFPEKTDHYWNGVIDALYAEDYDTNTIQEKIINMGCHPKLAAELCSNEENHDENLSQETLDSLKIGIEQAKQGKFAPPPER